MKQRPFELNPELEQITFLDERYYADEINGRVEYYPSVSFILGTAYPKPKQFLQWLKDNGEEADDIRDLAAEKGSAVHAATEDIDSGKEVKWQDSAGNPMYSEEVWDMICKYYDFVCRFSPKIIANEHGIFNREMRYAGTIDRVIELNGEYILMDIKTSKSVSDIYWMQLASYTYAWNILNPDYPIKRTAIMWLRASTRTIGKPEKGDIQGYGWQLKFDTKSVEERMRIFKHAKAIFDVEIPLEKQKPAFKRYPSVLKRDDIQQ
jgi:hypothetical protein